MIRPAREADAQRIGQLWMDMVAYHQQFDPVMFRAVAGGGDLYARRILDRLRDRQSQVLVAECDGGAQGYCLAAIADITADLFLPLRCGLLADIYVAPAYRRRGLGRGMIERAMLWFRQRDINHFEWHVSAGNDAAIAFWRALGGQATMLRMRAGIGGGGS